MFGVSLCSRHQKLWNLFWNQLKPKHRGQSLLTDFATRLSCASFFREQEHADIWELENCGCWAQIKIETKWWVNFHVLPKLTCFRKQWLYSEGQVESSASQRGWYLLHEGQRFSNWREGPCSQVTTGATPSRWRSHEPLGSESGHPDGLMKTAFWRVDFGWFHCSLYSFVQPTAFLFRIRFNNLEQSPSAFQLPTWWSWRVDEGFLLAICMNRQPMGECLGLAVNRVWWTDTQSVKTLQLCRFASKSGMLMRLYGVFQCFRRNFHLWLSMRQGFVCLMALNVLRPSHPTGYAATRPSAGPLAAPYSERVKPKVKTQKTPKPIFVSSSLEDWLRPEAMSYQSLHFPRKVSWRDYQMEIDRSIGAFGPECSLERKVFREGAKDVDFRWLFSRKNGSWVSDVKSEFMLWILRSKMPSAWNESVVNPVRFLATVAYTSVED